MMGAEVESVRPVWGMQNLLLRSPLRGLGGRSSVVTRGNESKVD